LIIELNPILYGSEIRGCFKSDKTFEISDDQNVLKGSINIKMLVMRKNPGNFSVFWEIKLFEDTKKNHM